MPTLLISDLPPGLMPQLPRLLALGCTARVQAREAPREDAIAAWLTPAERWLLQALRLAAPDAVSEFEPEQAPWARICAAADGLADWAAAQPGLGLLTPAHLRLGRDSLSLDDPQQLPLTPEESEALGQAVAEVFAAQGWQLRRAAPQRWYAAHPSLAEVVTAAPARARGQSVAAWMPAGAPARPWRQLLTEVQMVWQQHPVNDARESRGLPPVNTLWLHGCGVLEREWCSPLVPPAVVDDAAAGDFATLLHGLRARACAQATDTLQILDAPAILQKAETQNQDPLAALDARIDEALQTALDSAGEATLVLAGTRGWASVQVRRRAGWRFWQRTDLASLTATV